MSSSNYRLTLNMQEEQSQVSLPVRLGDTNRVLYISIADGGKPFKIELGSTAWFFGKKADGKEIITSCIIEGESVVRYNFNEQTASYPGIVDCEIRLYDKVGKHLASPRFVMVVDERVIYDEEVTTPSDDYVTLLDQLLYTDAILKENERLRETAENGRVTAEGGRKSEEQNRIIAESTRITKEGEREGNEAIRKANETTRSSNETSRKEQEAKRVTAEKGRVTAEEGRVTAEGERDQNESGRKEAETSRKEQESERQRVEGIRLSNEWARDSAEKGRVNAENLRVYDENSRARAEESRARAETLREIAETSRDDFESTRRIAEGWRVEDENKRNTAEQARASAESARVSNEETRVANEEAREERLLLAEKNVERLNRGLYGTNTFILPTVYDIADELFYNSHKDGDIFIIESGDITVLRYSEMPIDGAIKINTLSLDWMGGKTKLEPNTAYKFHFGVASGNGWWEYFTTSDSAFHLDLEENCANAIKAKASGEVVRVDDVSSNKHSVKCKVRSDSNINLASVKVTRRGKNLVIPIYTEATEISGTTITPNIDNSLTLNGTATDKVICRVIDTSVNRFTLKKGTYTFSFADKLPANLYCIIEEYANGVWVGQIANIKEGESSKTFTVDHDFDLSVYIRITQGTTLTNYTVKPMLENGDNATEYEAPVDATTHTPTSDGTVYGIKSVAPTMTLFTDTEGVEIEIEYNQDLNVLLDYIKASLRAIIDLQNAKIGGEA